MSAAKKIYLTQSDYEVLDEVVGTCPDSGHAGFLEGELARAEILSDHEIPENVVTLHSRARVLDESTSQEREYVIVPPHETGPRGDTVSVLAPLGASVIGLREGQAIDWPMPSGRSRRFRVVKVLFQPEADRRTRRQKRTVD